MESNPESNGVAAAPSDTASSLHSGLLASKDDNSAKQPAPPGTSNLSSTTAEAGTTPGQVDVSQLSREEIARIVIGGFHGSIQPHTVSQEYVRGLLLCIMQFPRDAFFPALLTTIIVAIFLLVLWLDETLAIALVLLSTVPCFIAVLAALTALKLRCVIGWFRGVLAHYEPRRCNVSPEEEPLLWEFVRRIADTVGVRHPSQIELVCEANAAAARVTDTKVRLTNRHSLVIGLPLTAGTTVQQLAGIIAHELGHCSQKAGTRLTLWLRLLIDSTWWPGVSRDELDDKLLATIQAARGRIARTPTFSIRPYWFSFWLFKIRNVCESLQRPILAHAYANRQIEYDADQYQARFAGSDQFEQTSKCLAMHFYAFVSACDDVTRYYRERRLPDNLLPLVDSALTSCSPKTRDEFEKLLSEEETKSDDTYPSQRDRIAAARQFNAPGVYQCDLPASVLFRNLDEWSRRVTHHLYLKRYDATVSVTDLLPVDVLLSEKKIEAKRHDDTHAFCLGTCLHNRSVPVPHGEDAGCSASSERSMAELVGELETVRHAMSDHAASYNANILKWYDAVEDVWKGNAAESLLKEGVERLPKELAEFDGKPDLALQRQQSGRAELGELNTTLLEFETMAGRRWHIAIEILAHPDFSSSTRDAPAEVEQAKATMQLIAALDRSLRERRELHDHLRTMQHLLDAKRDTYSMWLTIYERLVETKSRHESILRQFEGCEYPFPNNRPNFTVVEYLTPFEDMTTISKKWLDGAWETISASRDLAKRATDFLCALTLEVEAALGLPPLPLVVTSKEEGDDVSQAASNAA